MMIKTIFILNRVFNDPAGVRPLLLLPVALLLLQPDLPPQFLFPPPHYSSYPALAVTKYDIEGFYFYSRLH